MANFKELQEQRSKLAADIKTLGDTQDEWTSEDNAKWDELNVRYDENLADLEKAEKAATVAARIDELNAEKDRQTFQQKRQRTAEQRPEITDETRSLAFAAWARQQNGFGLEDAHVEAAQRLGLDPKSNFLDVRLAKKSPSMTHEGFGKEFRAQSVGTDSAGGYLVPEGFSNELEKSLLAFGGPRSVSRVIRTSTGNTVPFPTSDDTANKGALLAENAAISEQAATFGVKNLAAYKLTSKSILVSAELLQDSFFDLGAEVGAMLGERIGRIEAQYSTTGSGSSEPQGVVVGSGLGKTAAAADAIASDELFDLLHSVDPAYRNSASFGWMMHDNILLALRKLKDDNNHYLWQEGMSVGEPDRLLGYPITINQDMQSSVATDEKTVLVGDFSRFIIRDAGPIRMFRLEERYRDNDQTGFVGFARFDSKVLNSSAIKHLIQA